MAARAKHRTHGAACLLMTLLIIGLAAGALSQVWPDASGDDVQKKSGTVIDASHAGDGYIMVRHKESKKALKLRVSKDDQNYDYDLNREGRYEVIPLQMGSGKYKVSVFSQVSGNKYTQASQQTVKVSLSSEVAPFLCPSQYVWYDQDSPAVLKAAELCEGLERDQEKMDAIVDYVSRNFTYDYILALTVNSQKGYLPDLDDAFEQKKGICFHIAGMVCAMLRSQDVPVQLVIGYADKTYHAWNEIYVDGEYQFRDVTGMLTKTKAGTYTAERIY